MKDTNTTPDYYLAAADIEGYDMLEILLEVRSLIESGYEAIEVEDWGIYDKEKVDIELSDLGY
jgi:hypothetical protein